MPKLCMQTHHALYSRRRQRAPTSGLSAYDQAVSAINWAAARGSETSSLRVHVHLGWDSVIGKPAFYRGSEDLHSFHAQLAKLLESRQSSYAKIGLKACIHAAELDSEFCLFDGIWLQVCPLAGTQTTSYLSMHNRGGRKQKGHFPATPSVADKQGFRECGRRVGTKVG